MIPDAPPPYEVVVFDCDSTLSRIEGIEDLAGEQAGEIEALTRRAMDGELPLEAVYGARLELIRPGRADLERVARRYVETLMPGARELVAALRRLEKRVCIVSGGLLPAVAAVGRELGLDPAHVRAVDMIFEQDGSYRDFDRSSPLARAGGKVEVVRELCGGRCGVLVGDGATDLEALPAVARFVAFGGVVRRPAVFAGAAAGYEGEDLRGLAPWLLSADERGRCGL